MTATYGAVALLIALASPSHSGVDRSPCQEQRPPLKRETAFASTKENPGALASRLDHTQEMDPPMQPSKTEWCGRWLKPSYPCCSAPASR
jgi:hypothetical protein